ncbi:MAG: PspC domain-containing protein [Candidatus Falkowbacteria bacterium]
MPYKKLYRSSRDKIIAGVCGGLAEYFEIDSTIIRAAFIVLTLAGGSGILLYIILALITPSDVNQEATPRDNLNDLTGSVKSQAQAIAKELKPKRNRTADSNEDLAIPRSRFYLGLIVCFIGFILLINNFVPTQFNWFWSATVWPLTIIFIGIYLIRKK